MTEATSSWEDYVIATTPYRCMKSYSRNDPLILNLSRVFAYLCRNLELLYNYRQCLHMFINRTLPETDVLFIGDRDPDNISPSYRRRRLSDSTYNRLREITRWEERSSKCLDVPEVYTLNSATLSQLLKLIEVESSIPEGDTILLVPFDFADLNLGLFVMWGKRASRRKRQPPENERLRGWVASTYFFLKEFLEREYPIASATTYLPSFYAVQWARAAILFADIRNFTPLTEILRNTHAHPERPEPQVLREMLNEYCQEMAKIIQQNNRGRIDSFFGAGIMAVFGEYEDNPSKAACNAVYVASQMIKCFRELKPKFLKMAFGGDYDIEYNESVDINLAVGVDYGTVLFDYLGDQRHREYTVIGDHVNFAKQLERQALRFDEDKERLRRSILISPTVERCIRPWVRDKERYEIRAMERNFAYTVYGLDFEDFREDIFDKCEQNKDWKSPWADHDWIPPLKS